MDKIKAVSYEELRTIYFTEQMKEYEDNGEEVKAQLYRDALSALNWRKIEPDEEGLYTGNLPDIGEEVLFCRKDGSVYIDELCDDGVYDDGNIMVYLGDSGHDLDTVAAWMPIPKPYKESE